MLLDHLRRGNDHIAIQLDAVVGVRQHHHVLGGHAARFQVQQRGEGEAGDGVQIAACQHGFAQRRVHGRPLHAVDLVGLGEDREGAAAGVKYRCAQALAVQVGRLLDAGFLQRHHRGRRVVVDHHHRDRLVRRVRVVGLKFHQRRQIGEAHVIGAGGHARDRTARTIAGVHADVQPCVLEIAFGSRHQEQCRRAFKTPVELELDGRHVGQRDQGGESEHRSGSAAQKMAFVHGGSRAGKKLHARVHAITMPGRLFTVEQVKAGQASPWREPGKRNGLAQHAAAPGRPFSVP